MDGKFLLGYYFGELFAFSSFRGLLNGDENLNGKVRQIRSQMSLREPLRWRERPDISNNIVDVCKCGHEWLHDSQEPRGACFTCLCPRYQFEQKITRAEASELSSFDIKRAAKEWEQLANLEAQSFKKELMETRKAYLIKSAMSTSEYNR